MVYTLLKAITGTQGESKLSLIHAMRKHNPDYLCNPRVQDPGIKSMAEQIAQDPAFAQMSAALQASMANGGGVPGAPGAGGQPSVDPEQYAQAMAGVLGNPGFMEMAEKLGQQIMSVSASILVIPCGLWVLQVLVARNIVALGHTSSSRPSFVAAESGGLSEKYGMVAC